MGEKLVVGPLNRGYRNDREPFVIDNDNFPMLVNAYQWRGRVKRKRGTSLLNRLSRFIGTTDGAGNITVTIAPTPILPEIVTFVIGTDIFVDPGGGSPVTLITNSAGATHTLNRATGVLTITGSIPATAVLYFPTLPVMGLEDLILEINQFPGTLAFDTTYSYNISTRSPYPIYDVSFYKNPPTGSIPGYTQKANPTPTSWNGANYQQFWTTNYQGALWATNGIDIGPTTLTTVGMQFSGITNVAAPVGQTVNITVTGPNLIVGDFVFLNEFDPSIITGINLQSGFITAGSSPGVITVTLPDATLAGPGGLTSKGIVQYLTNRSNTAIDSLRWYDGDPTNGVTPAPSFVAGKGWVNFSPPINFLPAFPNFSVADLPVAQYYLVGARMIVPFKDRLLFFGPVVQTSSSTVGIYLQDTVIYSQNGTAYYTASYTNTPVATKDTPATATTVFNPILVPVNQTATSTSYLEDFTGFGGFITAGVDQPIITVSPNEDVLIVGFDRLQTRFVYTGNDIVPFDFFSINSQLGSGSTFSVITLDKGIITRGNRGFVITSQVECQRIDLEIPDQVFQIVLSGNGSERVTAQRDYINEWIYFTYPSNEFTFKNDAGAVVVFPNQTLQYNYRDNSWAIFNESYTTYGQFKPATGNTWATIGSIFPTWSSWNVPWNAGASTLFQPKVIAGNQQGFVVFRDDSTDEANSLAIQNIVGSTIISPNHFLNEGDYIVINGALGTVGAQVNGNIFSVSATVTANTFNLNPSIAGGTYLGGATIQRMYVPFIQTKQFPSAWGMARQTRIGPQQYLFTRTPNGQITIQIYLSQDATNPYNAGTIVPAITPLNNSLIYSQVAFTSPDLYIQNAFKVPLGSIGNGVLTTFTFLYPTIFKFTGNLIAGSLSINVGSIATFVDNGTGGFTITGTGTSVGSSIDYNNGIVIIAFTVAPTSQITTTSFQYSIPNIQSPTASTQAQIWHRINTSLIGDTVQLGFTMSDAQMRDPTFSNQFEEIEIHGFIIDTNPAQVLA